MKKYELSNEKKEFFENTVYRVRALKDFGDVKKGDLGGFVEDEYNLSQEGECWIYGDMTYVIGYAVVKDNAKIYGDTTIAGDVHIGGNVVISGAASIFGDFSISGNAIISGEFSIC